jgi:hypothetical protein
LHTHAEHQVERVQHQTNPRKRGNHVSSLRLLAIRFLCLAREMSGVRCFWG